MDGVCSELPECDDGEYFDGEACGACGQYCSSCDAWTGDCNDCSEEDMVVDGMDCGCPEGTMFDGEFCNELVECDDGEYRTDENECGSCMDNCMKCEDLSGACTECDSGYVVDSTGMCAEPSDDCTPYGPVDEPAGC